jgi:hypothetical protein
LNKIKKEINEAALKSNRKRSRVTKKHFDEEYQIILEDKRERATK